METGVIKSKNLMPSLPDLHPYDGVERRFSHTDTPNDMGIALVLHLLHLEALPCAVNVRYDLSFFSGGIGIYDQLAISISANDAAWGQVAAALRVTPPEEAAGDPAWGEDFIWLVSDEEESISPRAAAVQFINQKRFDFQPECKLADRILFEVGSDGNSWLVLWGCENLLNYRSFDQG
jgi:hypothetical protein